MLTHLKNVSKDTLIYGIGSSLSSLVTFALIPLYGYYFSPTEYGYLTLIVTFQTILEISILFGFNTGFFRYYIMAVTEEEKNSVYSSSHLLVLITGLIVFFFVFVFNGELTEFLLGDSGKVSLVYIAALTAFLNSFMTIGFSQMRSERKSVQFGIFQLFRVTMIGLFNVVFIALFSMKYDGVIWGNLIASCLMTAAFYLFVTGKIKYHYSYETAKKIFLFSIPVFAGNITYYSLGFADRFFLNSFVSKEELGIYSLGVKISSILNAGLISPFSTAVVPYALSIAKENYFEATYQNIIRYFVSVLFSVSIVLMVFAKEIIGISSSPEYSMAWMIIGPVIISNVFYALFYNFTIVLDIREKTFYGLIIIAISSVVSLILNFILIKKYGIRGAIFTNIISNLTLVLLSYFFCQRIMKIRYPVFGFWVLLGIYMLSTGVIYFFNFYDSLSILADYIIKALFTCIVIPLSLFISGLIGKKELQFAVGIIKRRNIRS